MANNIILDNGEGTIKWARGSFSVPKGAKGHPLERAVYQACKKFGEVLLKQGWALMGEPKVTKIKVSDTGRFIPKLSQSRSNTGADINLWVPQGTPGVMRTDHPWYKSGTDQYDVAWMVKKRSQPVKLMVPDSIVEKGLLPAGVKLVE